MVADNKLFWCKNQRTGLRLIEPNENLVDAYFKKAQDALESLSLVISRDWKISTAYYSMYFSLYALLMKLGVVCEIHSCTLEFAKIFLKEYFSKDEFDFMETSLRARIDSQYYVNKSVAKKQFDLMVSQAPLFLLTCKSVAKKLSEKEIVSIRSRF